MSILKYISTIIIIFALSWPTLAISRDNGSREPNKKSTFSKSGNFKKDESFNVKNTRFGPPDPGGGGGGDPVPVDPAYGLIAVSGIAFTIYFLRRRKKQLP